MFQSARGRLALGLTFVVTGVAACRPVDDVPPVTQDLPPVTGDLPRVTEGVAPETKDLLPGAQSDAARVALTAKLPYGVDVSGAELSIMAVEADVTLEELLADKRHAVLNTFPAVSREPDLPGSSCAGDDCRQVEIYNYADATTLVATVDLAAETVLDLHVLPDAAPALSEALVARVEELIRDDPRVLEELQGRDYEITMGPVAARQESGACATHWCVLVDLAPEGELSSEEDGDRIIVIVDVHNEAVVDVFWRSTMRQEPEE